jgi:hypothetical protein
LTIGANEGIGAASVPAAPLAAEAGAAATGAPAAAARAVALATAKHSAAAANLKRRFMRGPSKTPYPTK